MPEFSSNVVWNFDDFVPNTIWAAQMARTGQRITSQQLDIQKSLLKKKTMTALAKDTDPISLIRQSHDFLILDRKQRSKIGNLNFDFKSESGYYGPKGETPEPQQNAKWPEIAHKINKLDMHLQKSWKDCDTIISNLRLDANPLEKRLYQHLEDATSDVKVLLLGNNVIGVGKQIQDFVCYAIKQKDEVHPSPFQEDIEKDLQSLLGKSYLLGKYIIVFKRVNEPVESAKFYSIELKIEFFQDKNKDKNKNSLAAKFILIDNQSLFAQALGSSLMHSKLLQDYEFNAHGDYIEYPFKESVAKRRRYMIKQSYSLVFQGGGAKGAAYVGAYAAIKQQKRGQHKVPITSIMGSSAGGIIALAVSTDIDPYEVQKICYKMGAIPRDYRIDRKYLTGPEGRFTEADIDGKETEMIEKIIKLLSEYGLIHSSSLNELKNILLGINRDKLSLVFQKLVQYLLASNESIGQMFDSRQLSTYKFNYLGLLLEGALMRGEAIYDIGLEVLVKFMLKNQEIFNNEDKQIYYAKIFGRDKFNELKTLVNGFDGLCGETLNLVVGSIVRNVENQSETRILFSIINKILMIVGRNLARHDNPGLFMLDQLFANNIYDCFQVRSIYNQNQVPHEDLEVGLRRLYSIIYNHHKIHPDSKDLEERDVIQKGGRRDIIKNIIRQNGGISYDKLSQQLAEEYFLNSKNFKLKPQYSQFTLKQLIAKIVFKHNQQVGMQGQILDNIFRRQYQILFNDKFFIRELAQIITDTLNGQPSTKNLVERYINQFERFKQSVKDIDLSTYYKLTKIELSCTSVDLDNQMLRFFNHKTTPKLPVCRAIQMTGSFPVGFKALSWLEGWGNYLVHYDNYRRQVFLTGHQFTDGGLLANFPIKYFDNEFIRDCYFSHVINRSQKIKKHPYETILLGFGLDRLAAQNYSPSEDETNTIEQTQIASQKAMIALKRAAMDAIGYDGGKLSAIQLGIKFYSLAKTFLYPQRDGIAWKKIPQNLIKDIPIVNFAFKLLNAYPRADRNLNLECFKDKIYRTVMTTSTQPVQDRNLLRRLDIQAQIYKPQRNGSVLQKQDNGWFSGWFGRGNRQEQAEHPQNLHQLIQQAVDRTPLKSQYFPQIENYCNHVLDNQSRITNRLAFEDKLDLKRKIKQTLVSIIMKRMKLQLSQKDIQWQTLQFISLRYAEGGARPNMNEKQKIDYISRIKFQDQIKKRYYRIEEELPFKDFKKKMQEIELLIDFKQYNPRRSQEQLQRLYSRKINDEKNKLINQKKKYISESLSIDDKKEYFNLPAFYISQNEKYLIQFIFLSKLRPEHLGQANQLLQKKSVKQIIADMKTDELGGYQINREPQDVYAYLTVKDLKAFYRRLFSSHKDRYQSNSYNPDTFLEKQSLLGYQQENLPLQLNDTNNIEVTQQFNSDDYLRKQLKINHLHSQHLYWKKSVIGNIQFSRLLWEAFSDSQARSSIQRELMNMITAYQAKYNKMLAEQLYPKAQKVFTQDFFRQLIQNQALTRPILSTLFDGDGLYYSKNQHVVNKYNQIFGIFRRDKQQKLTRINQEILNPPAGNDRPGYSLRIQRQFFTRLQSQINFKLLIKRITAAKDPSNYNLKTADLTSGMSVETDRKYRQELRTQINNQQSQKASIYEEMLGKIYLYQYTFDKFEQYIKQIMYIIQRQYPGAIYQQSRPGLQNNLMEIKQRLKDQFNKINSMPIESIELKHIQELFTLKNSGIMEICKQIMRITWRIQARGLDNHIAKYQSLFNCHFQLPQFKIIWNTYRKQFKQQKYSTAILNCLNKQYSNSFIQKISNVERNPQQQIMLHLILQGNDLSNYYYAHYYEILQNLRRSVRDQNQQQQQEPNNDKQPVKWNPYQIEKNASRLRLRAITTSSYHSIFGMLVALRYSSCRIAQEMIKIRDIAYQFEPKELVKGYYDSYQWNTSSSQYKEFWKYIKEEKYNVFRQFQKLANRSLSEHDLTSEFAKIKSLYEHQQQKIMRYCHEILDEVSQQVQNIDKNVDPRYKALQISQKYAYNYTCSLKRQHEFSTISKESYQFYEKIIKKLFAGYGSLIEAVITNAYTVQSKVSLPKFEQGFIFKGFIVKQLLTTFKIKEYVIEKLKQHNLRESITLSEFFSNAPSKILLNFTTINVHKKRLQFMNKNTLPNMPLWAAIVSASCLPYFYRDFECTREWENTATDIASLYDLLVNHFFNRNSVVYKQAKYISGNIISSLPMQLLTNSTTLQKMFTFEDNSLPYLHIGMAFDVNQNIYQNKAHYLKRNYLEVDLSQIKDIIFSKPTKPKFNKNCIQVGQNHNNLTYNKSQSMLSKLLEIKGRTEILKYISILSESNDNFMLHTYWDKLVRLPIKIDTLNFNQIIDKSLERRFAVNVASEKGKNTIQRSYEITKYFQKPRFQTFNNRHQINMRISIIRKDDEIYGKVANIAKVQLLSHSKWNRNRSNNFFVQYSTNHSNFESQAKFAFDSQFLWNINDSPVIYLRFYYPSYAGEENADIHSSVKFTQLQFNISDIIEEIPLKNSYDYSLNFRQKAQDQHQRDLRTGLILSNEEIILPFKKNAIPTNPAEVRKPRLLVKKWLRGDELDNKSYIQHL